MRGVSKIHIKGSQSEDTNICWAAEQLAAGLDQHLESGGRDESLVDVSLSPSFTKHEYG